MALKYVGEKEFTEQCEPVPGKSEFGIDTLQRKFRGATDLLDAYLAGLAQGDAYGAFYLQTWETDGNPKGYTEVTLHYKGLLSGIPDPKVSYSNTTKTASVTAENSYGDSVTFDILYISPQCTTKNIVNTISSTEPSRIFDNGSPQLRISTYIDPNDGRRKTGYPVTPPLIFETDIDSDTFEPVYGTPYLERETVVSGIIK